MIVEGDKEYCCNVSCSSSLMGGRNVGGLKTVKLEDDNWKSGYICKSCANMD